MIWVSGCLALRADGTSSSSTSSSAYELLWHMAGFEDQHASQSPVAGPSGAAARLAPAWEYDFGPAGN
jgi:hypothetical protein